VDDAQRFSHELFRFILFDTLARQPRKRCRFALLGREFRQAFEQAVNETATAEALLAITTRREQGRIDAMQTRRRGDFNAGGAAYGRVRPSRHNDLRLRRLRLRIGDLWFPETQALAERRLDLFRAEIG